MLSCHRKHWIKNVNMPVPLAEDFLAMQSEVESSPYPATTKQAAGLVSGTHTNVTVISFTDKIVVTIIQDGRLAQWVIHSNLTHHSF